jgi:hypothetical protein
MRCGQCVPVAGSTGETLLHAPPAMLYHWNIIQFHNKQNHIELMSPPLFFTSNENYLRLSKSFQVSLNWIEKFGCQKPTKYGQFMFYEAVKNDLANSKETSFNNTISSTLSFITVFIEDLFEAVNIQAVLVGEKEEPTLSITSPNKTNTCDGYDFNIDIINDDEYNAVQKESLMMFEGFCIFGFWEFLKNFFCMLMEANKTMYQNNEDVPKSFFDNFYQESHLGDVTFAVVWNVLVAGENKSVNRPSLN